MAPPPHSRPCCCGCITPRRFSCLAPSSRPAWGARANLRPWRRRPDGPERAWLLPRDREFSERDTQIPAATGATQGQRNLALCHGACAGGFHRAGVGFGVSVAAEDLLDVLHGREFPVAIF